MENKLHEELLDLFKGGDLYTMEAILEALGHRYTEDEVADAIAELTHKIQLTTYWFPKKDEEKFEAFDGNLD